jgi:hypothetical protein
MITYGFIKKVNEDETMNIINKIIVGTFGIMIGVLIDFFVVLVSPSIILALSIYYIIEKIIGEVK